MERPHSQETLTKPLITGMSGTGKSTAIRHLAARGYHAVDLDEPGWSAYQPALGRLPGGRSYDKFEWMWLEDRVRALLDSAGPGAVFVSGCAANQVRFYPDFDHIVLLTAPVSVITERLATRTTNSFGKHPTELAHVLRDVDLVEPLLRKKATLEIDTTAAPQDVLAQLVALAANSQQLTANS